MKIIDGYNKPTELKITDVKVNAIARVEEKATGIAWHLMRISDYKWMWLFVNNDRQFNLSEFNYLLFKIVHVYDEIVLR